MCLVESGFVSFIKDDSKLYIGSLELTQDVKYIENSWGE